jgi:hypothetical protein
MCCASLHKFGLACVDTSCILWVLLFLLLWPPPPPCCGRVGRYPLYFMSLLMSIYMPLLQGDDGNEMSDHAGRGARQEGPQQGGVCNACFRVHVCLWAPLCPCLYVHVCGLWAFLCPCLYVHVCRSVFGVCCRVLFVGVYVVFCARVYCLYVCACVCVCSKLTLGCDARRRCLLSAWSC